MSYSTLLSLKDVSFASSRVLIVGAGWMAEQYCRALAEMQVRDVTVVSRSEQSALRCCGPFGFQPRHGGYEACLPGLPVFDLVIVATPLAQLRPAAQAAMHCGNRNILVEKPASLYSAELRAWDEEQSRQSGVRIRVAYNRLVYPNLWKLKELVADEGGITSCRYAFTELTHTINFTNNSPETYARWAIANSLHVISMAHDLIGMPARLTALQSGALEWHPNGDRFTGVGLTTTGVPFSYHADWSSAGRWSVEVMTRANAYRLMPLEELWRNERRTFDWKLVPTASAFPGAKQGIAEETAVMLHPDIEARIPLTTLGQAAAYTALGERMCGYAEQRADCMPHDR